MGAYISKISFLFPKFDKYKGVNKILIFGLDASGKTTMLYHLKTGEMITTIPTIGFNVETIFHKDMSFDMFDFGGGDKIRPLWRHYATPPILLRALILTVDSADRDRIAEAKDYLWMVIGTIEHNHLIRSIPILIICNKQDLPDAMTITEIEDSLDLPKITDHSWHAQPTVATTGQGLLEGLDWLSKAIKLTEYTNSPDPVTTSTTTATTTT